MGPSSLLVSRAVLRITRHAPHRSTSQLLPPSLVLLHHPFGKPQHPFCTSLSSSPSPAVISTKTQKTQTSPTTSGKPLHKSSSSTQQQHITTVTAATAPTTTTTRGVAVAEAEAAATTATTSHFKPLLDSFNRPHSYLRISLTERCNLRCVYCMPDTTTDTTPPPTHLTADEILRLAGIFVSRGVTKLRLTGGEPLLRPDLVPITAALSSLSPLSPLHAQPEQPTSPSFLSSASTSPSPLTIALTTNAITLHRHLGALVDAGLSAINISLDTLDPLRFELLTRRRGHERVLAAIDDSLAAGLRVRVNAVVMRGVNDDELGAFVELGASRAMDIRFIEYMPFDGNRWASRKFLPYADMLQKVSRYFGRLEHVPTERSDTTKYYRVPGYKGRVGFITSMTDNFCSGCNRIRVTADGNLKVCLFGNEETSLRDIMRDGGSDADIEQAVRDALHAKHFSLGGKADMHDISRSDNRSMVRIGG